MRKRNLIGLLIALALTLSACPNTPQPPAQTNTTATWDSSTWDSSIWQ